MEAASLCAWQESNLRKVPSISGQEAGSEQYTDNPTAVAACEGGDRLPISQTSKLGGTWDLHEHPLTRPVDR
jgi:hypothetical protein